MKNLLVQDFLETHSFGELAEQHGVYASFSKSGHKFSLNYDQIEAKESDPLSQQCRALILAFEDGKSFNDKAELINGKLNFNKVIPGKTVVLARVMDRFFNLGQGSAKEIDWNNPNLEILSKIDGSLITLMYDPFIKSWCVASRSVPEADLLMDNGLFTFRTLFEKAVQETLNISFKTFTKSLVPEMTYFFELTSPLNRVVCYYPGNSITLLGARYLPTMEERNPEDLAIVKVGGVPTPKKYKFNNINDLVDFVNTLNPIEHEGVVVKDSNFNRIKVKNINYLALSKVRDRIGKSERNCIELILNEKDDDAMQFLPEELQNNLLKLKNGLLKAIKLYDQKYIEIKANADKILKDDKKTFALQLKLHPELYSAPLFAIHQNKADSMKDYIFKCKKLSYWSDGFLDKLLELSKNEF